MYQPQLMHQEHVGNNTKHKSDGIHGYCYACKSIFSHRCCGEWYKRNKEKSTHIKQQRFIIHLSGFVK